MPAGDATATAGLGRLASPRFEFATAARIIFGAGTCGELPGIAVELSARLLVVTGKNSERHGALVERIRAAAEHVEVLTVSSEPSVELAESGAQLARARQCGAVLAIGGGSVIDAGKAIAALAANPGPALDYLEVVGRALPLRVPALPVIAVPTTAGTGAEATRNAVLSVPSARVKVSLRSAHMLPRVALVDPTLAVGLPASITAATGMDALTQLIEPYVSHRASPMTDALCRDGMVRVARALPRAVREPSDTAARGDLALGALYSGMALANAGLGAVHGFAAPIGGLYPAPHGAVCAALLPHVLRANLAALERRAPGHPSCARFVEIAVLLTGRSDASAQDAVEFCAALVRDLAIPGLRTWGLDTDAIPTIVDKAAAASSMKANPLSLSKAELTRILEDALAADS